MQQAKPAFSDYIKLPVRSDGMIYLWDDDSNMVADVHQDDGELLLSACAAALNYAHGHLPEEAARASLKASMITLPVRVSGRASLEIADATNAVVLRIRGWGRLQYLGEDEAIKAQELIAAAFVDALNALQV